MLTCAEANGQPENREMADFDEEALINAVLRVRVTQPNLTAAETHAVLSAEPEFAEVPLPAVKKAAGKATKRAAKEAAAAPPAAKKADAAPAPPPVLSSAKQAKQQKAQATELSSAQSGMMDAQRRLRAAKSGGDAAAMAVTVNMPIEQFIQQISTKAMAGLLDPGEERFLKERVEADIAALEWVKLAQKAGALQLTEDIIAVGSEIQLTRLKEVRGCRDLPAALACYKRSGDQENGSYTNVDKALSRTGALAGVKSQEGELDDID